jgi:hypothetical protein
MIDAFHGLLRPWVLFSFVGKPSNPPNGRKPQEIKGYQRKNEII